MEKSIEKIKQALEQKRKNNIELLNELREKSIILNAEKEKQKRYFLNKTSTFLNKKRKNSNLIESDINTSQIKNNENISYEMINAYEDYDEYYEDFMNNSFMTNKIFNNLNFCRPERFSLNKNKKKKLSIKNEEGFTIKKTIKPKEISSSINISYESKIKNENDTTFGFILEKKNNDIKKDDKEISFFDINNDNKEQNDKNLFLKPITPINNEKSLFSSNIPEKKEEEQIKNKEINNNENKGNNFNNDNNKEKKEENKLFGNIERLNSIENKDKTLFGDTNNTNKEKIPTPKKEEKKELTNSSDLGLFATTPTPTPEPDNEKKEEKKETNKTESASLFNNEEKEKEKKEKIILPPLILKSDKEEKDKENKENNTSLFGNTNFGFNDQNNKDSNDNNNKPIQENGNKTPLLLSGSLFGNTNTVSNSLFQNKEENNINMNENKEEKKETLNFSLFNNNMGNKASNTNTNTMTSLFNNNNNNNNNNEKINEEPKLNISASNATGSLATKDNPFLNPIATKNNLPNFFNVKDLNTNNNNNNSLFNNTSGFNNNQSQQGFSLFNNQEMKTENNNMNPPISIFNNNNQNNGGSLFSNNTNIFGAPSNNNQNSIFNFPTNSGIGTGQNFFSNGSNFNSGFSLGKTFKTDG